MKKLIVFMFSIVLLGSCEPASSSTYSEEKNEKKLVLNKSYNFTGVDACFSGSPGNQSYLCPSNWAVEFKTNNTAEIWAYTNDRYNKSCSSDVRYSYDELTNAVSIHSVNNKNVPQGCFSQFIRKWTVMNGYSQFRNENNFLNTKAINSTMKTERISKWLDGFEVKSLVIDSNWSNYWDVWIKEKTTYYANNMILNEDSYGNFCIENLPFNKINDVMLFINSIKQIYDIDGRTINVSDCCRYYYKNNKKLCWFRDEGGPCSEINIEEKWPEY